MIKQIFLLPHVKRGNIVSNKLVYKSCLRRCLPANICLDEDVLKTPWRRVSPSSSEDVLKTSSRRLDQDEYIRLSHSPSEDVFKMSSRRLDQDQCIHLSHSSSRRLQDVFKTSCQVIFKTSCQYVFKTSAKMSSRDLQDVLQGVIRLNCLRSSKICLGHTSEKFMVSEENLQVW